MWQTVNGKLQKEIVCSNFVSALQIINKIGLIAEQSNHHPDILLHDYKKITLFLFTHEANAITSKDRDLSEKIDVLLLEKNI